MATNATRVAGGRRMEELSPRDVGRVACTSPCGSVSRERVLLEEGPDELGGVDRHGGLAGDRAERGGLLAARPLVPGPVGAVELDLRAGRAREADLVRVARRRGVGRGRRAAVA